MKKTFGLTSICACVMAAALMTGGCGQKADEAPETTTVAETAVEETTTEAPATEAATTEKAAEEETGETESSQEETEATSQEESEDPETAVEAAAEPAATGKTVADIYAEVKGQVSLYSPVEMQADFIANYYGIDTAALDEYVFSMSEDATSAEAVIIMKAKEEAAVEGLKAALGIVIEEKAGEMQNYLPEQYEIVEKSSVKQKGNYVYLVISEQADTILSIIEAGIQ